MQRHRTPAADPSTRTVYVIEPDTEELLFLCDFLGIPGFQVTGTSNPALALGYLCRARPDVMVCDLGRDLGRGLDFLQEAKRASPETRIVAGTTQADAAGQKEARKLGADELLVRPFTVLELLRTVERAVRLGAPWV